MIEETLTKITKVPKVTKVTKITQKILEDYKFPPLI
jgi:hypothetical protein